jgi:hypothetical protein
LNLIMQEAKPHIHDQDIQTNSSIQLIQTQSSR